MNGRQRAGSPPISRDGENPMQASHVLQAAGRRPEGQEFLSVVSLRPRRRLMEERPDRDRSAGPKSARRGVACPSGRNRSGNEAVLTATTKRSDMAWHVHGFRASRFPTRALQRNSSGGAERMRLTPRSLPGYGMMTTSSRRTALPSRDRSGPPLSGVPADVEVIP